MGILKATVLPKRTSQRLNLSQGIRNFLSVLEFISSEKHLSLEFSVVFVLFSCSLTPFFPPMMFDYQFFSNPFARRQKSASVGNSKTMFSLDTHLDVFLCLQFDIFGCVSVYSLDILGYSLVFTVWTYLDIALCLQSGHTWI